MATFRRKLARTASPPPPPPNLASKPTMVGGRKPGQPPGKRKQRPANLNLKPDGGAHLKATSPAEGYNVGGTPLHGSGTNGFGDEDDGSDMEFERPPSDRQQTLLQSEREELAAENAASRERRRVHRLRSKLETVTSDAKRMRDAEASAHAQLNLLNAVRRRDFVLPGQDARRGPELGS